MTRRARALPSSAFSSFARRVYALVRRIPPGRVMTYGAIAELIPCPAGMPPRSYRRVRARWVGYALAHCPDSIPWQRVVNAQGRVSPRLGHGPLIQRELLKREGVRFLPGDRISLGKFAWDPASSRRSRA